LARALFLSSLNSLYSLRVRKEERVEGLEIQQRGGQLLRDGGEPRKLTRVGKIGVFKMEIFIHPSNWIFFFFVKK
jgi:hypothetical protein